MFISWGKLDDDNRGSDTYELNIFSASQLHGKKLKDRLIERVPKKAQDVPIKTTSSVENASSGSAKRPNRHSSNSSELRKVKIPPIRPPNKVFNARLTTSLVKETIGKYTETDTRLHARNRIKKWLTEIVPLPVVNVSQSECASTTLEC